MLAERREFWERKFGEQEQTIVRLRQQNHDAAAARDQRNKQMERDLARMRASFAIARERYGPETWKHLPYGAHLHMADVVQAQLDAANTATAAMAALKDEANATVLAQAQEITALGTALLTAQAERDELKAEHEARKLDRVRLSQAIDQHFDSCMLSHRDAPGLEEFVDAIIDTYEGA